VISVKSDVLVQQTQSRTGREAERPRQAPRSRTGSEPPAPSLMPKLHISFVFMICAFVILPVFLAVVQHFLLRFQATRAKGSFCLALEGRPSVICARLKPRSTPYKLPGAYLVHWQFGREIKSCSAPAG
jgi:hypothetical protein